MAANKFATMLHRKTNKLTLILTYVILEWILIILLLLNALYSYLIIKFADYFGLKRPCLWCSRLDHIFEPQKYNNLHRDLVCENHANEISKLGYCSTHQKLAESQDLCEDCSSSSQSNVHERSKIAFFRWVKDIGMVQGDGEKIIENNGEVNLNCSCCDVSLNDKFYSPYVFIKPSWDVKDYTQKEISITEAGDGDHIDGGHLLDQSKSDNKMDRCTADDISIEEKREEGDHDQVTKYQMLSDVDGSFGLKELGSNEEDKLDVAVEAEQEHFYEDEQTELIKNPYSDEILIQVCCTEDAYLEIVPQADRSFAVENFDSTTTEDQSGKEDHGISDFQESNLVSELDLETEVVEDSCSIGETVEAASLHERKEEAKFALIESMELEENEDYLVFHATRRDLVMEVDEQVAITQATQTVSEDGDDVQETRGDFVMEVHEQFAFTQATQTVSEVVDDVQSRMVDSVMEVNEQVAIAQTTQTVSEVAGDVQASMADSVIEVHEQVTIAQATQTMSEDVDNVQATGATAGDTDSNVQAASVEVVQTQSDGNEVEILMGKEGADQEDQSTSSANLIENDDHGAKQSEEEQVECKPISIEINELVINKDLTLCSELNETEEERVPGTPTSIEGLHHLHKNLLLLEKRESGTEESLDGSVISEFESGEGVSTVEKLQSALRAERKALNALYAELEEERSAAAIAANQTMAMINRLQEEKAAMQMEAFQYQRMMEEQSEYDQEALQLLNELMVKREKEKQELEKELEIYRKKVTESEAREKLMMLKRIRDSSSIRSGTSSASFSNAEDSDGQSVDLNHEVKGDDSFYSIQESGNHNTPVDEILNLDESLAHFEEERMSILEQLKVLEEKLFTLDDEEEKQFIDVKPIEHFYEENGNHFDDNSDFNGEANGVENGFSMELNGKHHQEGRIKALKAKRLLPLFDAIDAESEDGELNGHENGFDSVLSQNSLSAKSESESNKLAIEEEVDHVYERLQALEADREFLRHCISSLKKGDKGIDLLQEILLHLRDLRNVDFRVKNIGDGVLQ